MDGHIT